MDIVKILRELIQEGFTSKTPTEPGEYQCTCSESDFEPYDVTVKMIEGELYVNDLDVGTHHMSQYDLTYLMWKRME